MVDGVYDCVVFAPVARLRLMVRCAVYARYGATAKSAVVHVGALVYAPEVVWTNGRHSEAAPRAAFPVLSANTGGMPRG